MRIALTIAGSDSGGGAGIQADLKTFAAHGVHGTTALTAITAQNSVAVARTVALDPALVVAQIETVASDMPLAAVKTGMLATAGIAAAVADVLRRLRLPRLVVDPVMLASSGDRLLDLDALGVLRQLLIPLAAVVTPNLQEAEALLGHSVSDVAAMREAARALRAWGAEVVVVKGGHLTGDAVDVFYDGARMEELATPRLPTPHTHGTGCVFSAAVAAELAKDTPVFEAVRAAKAFVTEAIRRGSPLGRGPGAVCPTPQPGDSIRGRDD